MNQPAAKLDSFTARYPLPIEGCELDEFSDTTNVYAVTIHLAGFATGVDGECITGSAADIDEPPFFRAYMELLERLAVLAAMRCREPITLRDSHGSRIGLVPTAHVFPEIPVPSRWNWSRSNGVAIAPTWPEAARRAHWELVERDRILRSFYGEIPPKHAPVELARIPGNLSEHFSFCAYSFDTGFRDGIRVAAVFGFPRASSGSDPLVYGFAARDTLAEAVAAAARECIQRLGFLFGEQLPDAPPTPAPTPDFHQEYFLFPGHHEKLRRWLRGEHFAHRGCLRLAQSGAPEDPIYADVTPPALEGRLFVAKALPRGHVPLAFGVGHPMLGSPFPEDIAVHPIA